MSEFKPRPWQLKLYELAGGCNRSGKLVLNIAPGGGKTIAPVIAGRVLLARGIINKIVVAVPRVSLRRQQEVAFLNPAVRAFYRHSMGIYQAQNETPLDKGMDGYVTTYVAIVAAFSKNSYQNVHLDYFRRNRCLLVTDEAHHIPDPSIEPSAYYPAIKPLFDLAAFNLVMTGTPIRNGRGRLGLVDYDASGIPQVDITYDIKQAMADRALIRPEFHTLDCRGEFIDTSESLEPLLFDSLNEDAKNLWVALRTDFAEQLLMAGYRHWSEWKQQHKRSRLLVVCMDIEQARMAKALLPKNAKVAIATCKSQEDEGKQALEIIEGYRDRNDYDILITVQMAYEGLDVPSITHAVCLTHIRSVPWILQMFGRAWRYDPAAGLWETQRAFLFIPADASMMEIVQYVLKADASIAVCPIQKSLPGMDICGAGPGGGGAEGPSLKGARAGQIIPLRSEQTDYEVIDGHADVRIGPISMKAIQDYRDRCSAFAHLSITDALHAMRQAATIFGQDIRQVLPDLIIGDTPTTPQQSPTHQPAPETTPTERIAAIRREANRLANEIDRMRGDDHGEMNKRVVKRYGKGRPEMTESELMECLLWMRSYAKNLDVRAF